MKVILTIITLFVSFFGIAQEMFEKLESLDEVSAVVITKDAFALLQKFPEAKSGNVELFNTIKGLEEVKVFTTEDTASVALMETTFREIIAKKQLSHFMRVKEKSSHVKIYVKPTTKEDVVSEVLLFINNKENTGKTPLAKLISLEGVINVNNLAKIADNY